MRALMRDLRTGYFYSPDRQWTAAERERGYEFESTFHALTFGEENRLDAFEVVLTFGEPEKDVAIGQNLERLAPSGNPLNL